MIATQNLLEAKAEFRQLLHGIGSLEQTADEAIVKGDANTATKCFLEASLMCATGNPTLKEHLSDHLLELIRAEFEASAKKYMEHQP